MPDKVLMVLLESLRNECHSNLIKFLPISVFSQVCGYVQLSVPFDPGFKIIDSKLLEKSLLPELEICLSRGFCL